MVDRAALLKHRSGFQSLDHHGTIEYCNGDDNVLSNDKWRRFDRNLCEFNNEQ